MGTDGAARKPVVDPVAAPGRTPPGSPGDRPDRESDAEIWRRAVTTDPEAFGLIFDRHADAVHRFCARRTGSADVADDLVSIVFLESWRRRHEVVLEHDSALPWLLGVARRTVLRRTRGVVRQRLAVARLPRALVVADPADDVARAVDGDRRLVAVARAFEHLGPADQDVVALCAWQGLDYASAAVALGIPVGTVRSRLSRARARLANLADLMENGGER